MQAAALPHLSHRTNADIRAHQNSKAQTSANTLLEPATKPYASGARILPPCLVLNTEQRLQRFVVLETRENSVKSKSSTVLLLLRVPIFPSMQVRMRPTVLLENTN